MAEFKHEENVERREEPSRVSATFIKYFFITLITIAILYFLIFHALPALGGIGDTGGNSGTGDGTSKIEIELNDKTNSGGGGE